MDKPSLILMSLISAGLLLTVPAQAQTETAEPPMPTLEAPASEAEQDELLEQFRRDIADGLRRFEAQEVADCSSADLGDTATYALEAQEAWTERDADPRLIAFSGTMLLDIADAARARGCIEIARDLYDYVLATFEGPAYEHLRQRAELALTGR